MKEFISIGIQYAGANFLPDTQMDAINIATTFTERGWMGNVYEEMSGENLLNILGDAAKRLTNKGDMFLFAFSGHGSQATSSLEDDGYNEGIVLWEKDPGYTYFFSDKLLVMALSKFTCPVIVWMDSCFAGGMDRNVAQPIKGQRKYLPSDLIDRICLPSALSRMAHAWPTNTQINLLAASEREYAISTGNGGMFTNAAIGCIKGNDKLFCNAYQVHRYAKLICKGFQKPRLTGRGYGYKTMRWF